MKPSLLLILVVTSCPGIVPAQTANPLSAEVKQAYQSVKKNIVGASEKMPEEGYAFKPTPEMRSFGEVVTHVIEAQTRACSAFKGEQKSASITSKAKADLIAALNQSFAECDAAYDSLTDAAASEMIKTPRGQRSRLGALVGNTIHDTEQYSAMAVYLRLKGVVPPSSEH